MYYSRNNRVEAEQVVLAGDYEQLYKVEKWLSDFSYVDEVYVLTEGGVPEGIYFKYAYNNGTEDVESVVAKRDQWIVCNQWIVCGWNKSFTVYDDMDFQKRYIQGMNS